MATQGKRPPCRVGTRVRVPLGGRKVTGDIIEDHGPIGAHGRRLYRIRVPIEPFEPMILVRAGDEVEPLNDRSEPAEIPDKARVIDYLKNGGLVSMLWRNQSGGKHQPRAWLCLDTLGNVTHTFDAKRGLVGGKPVPFGAIYEGTVFTAKTDEVASFLKSFGLSRREASNVIEAVGTSP